MQIQEYIDDEGRRTVRVPLMLTDSGIPGSVGGALPAAASQRQTVHDYADSRGVSESQAAYEMRLGDAWKARPGAIQPPPGDAAPVAVSSAPPVVTGDNGQAAYEARLKAAWQGHAA